MEFQLTQIRFTSLSIFQNPEMPRKCKLSWGIVATTNDSYTCTQWYPNLCITIFNDKNISLSERHLLLSELKLKKMPEIYISPAWSKINYLLNNLEEASSVVSKSWIIGFTEAEGSFYLVTKSLNRIVHGFEITQKLDKIVLDAIGLILGISVTTKKTYFTVGTTNSKSISNIISYYTNTMKGMKSLEFRIWARSYNKAKTDLKKYEYLTKVRDQMRQIRSIRFNKNFKQVEDN